MKQRVGSRWLLLCAISGFVSAPCAYAQVAAPVAHSQAEFDQLVARLNTNVNALGHAYDNESAKLFWFTDLEAAKKQAALENKPILSLRLLGKLSDEYSCANSRFFRTVLYPNAEINRLLRERFVLHWSSERPVPVVTIDMGDGRILKRTLTGNSAHYLMDSTGQVLDALPGMYAPGIFKEWLQSGGKLASNLGRLSSPEREVALKEWHKAQLVNLAEQQWKMNTLSGQEENIPPALLQKVKEDAVRDVESKLSGKWEVSSPSPNLFFAPFGPKLGSVVPAEEAGLLAVPKRRGEFPILLRTAPRLTDSPTVSDGERINSGRYAALYVDASRLDANSRAVLSAKLPPDSPIAINSASHITKNEAPLARDVVIARFEDAIAFDTAFNEVSVHSQIHTIFARGEQGDFATLNRTLYDRLFLTPSSDPWLGLLPEGVYNGLRNGGVVTPQAQIQIAARR